LKTKKRQWLAIVTIGLWGIALLLGYPLDLVDVLLVAVLAIVSLLDT
jgi:hypothetical protein